MSDPHNLLALIEEMNRIRFEGKMWDRSSLALRIGAARMTVYRWIEGRSNPTGVYLKALNELRDEVQAAGY